MIFYGPLSINIELENSGLSVLHSSFKFSGMTLAVEFEMCSRVHESSLQLGICKR